jgi:periplasmic divalent cation tolerance protein
MDENNQPIMVVVTAPDPTSARSIARTLVDKKIAACVNISPHWLSIYHWEGETKEDEEVLLLIKTTSGLFDDHLVPCIQEIHPYDVPEIIALPILAGEKTYLDWLIKEASGSK